MDRAGLLSVSRRRRGPGAIALVLREKRVVTTARRYANPTLACFVGCNKEFEFSPKSYGKLQKRS